MKVTIEYEDEDVRRALKRLANTAGERLLIATRDRFDSQKDPDGRPWAPLKPSTLARKRRNRDKRLTERGHLRGQLNYGAGAGPDFVEVGSSLIYAATHQFGAGKGRFGSNSRGQPIPWGDIPARPFLGVSDDDRETILEIVNDHLADALRP